VISTTPTQAAQAIFENPNIDVVGVSSHSGAHLAYVGEMLSALKELDPDRKPVVVVGGIIPSADRTILRDMGVDLIYGPGTVISSAAQDIMDAMGIPPVVDSRSAFFAR
jgi:methylmalonyl-CoA mutase